MFYLVILFSHSECSVYSGCFPSQLLSTNDPFLWPLLMKEELDLNTLLSSFYKFIFFRGKIVWVMVYLETKSIHVGNDDGQRWEGWLSGVCLPLRSSWLRRYEAGSWPMSSILWLMTRDRWPVWYRLPTMMLCKYMGSMKELSRAPWSPRMFHLKNKFGSNKWATLGKSANASTWVRGMRDETIPVPVLWHRKHCWVIIQPWGDYPSRRIWDYCDAIHLRDVFSSLYCCKQRLLIKRCSF